MNHWWRAYNEALHDPKLQLLSDALFRAWFNLMCLASSHGGEIPPLRDVAFALRLAEPKAAGILAQLHAAGLLDKTQAGFVPHNWDGRQFKSDRDETAASRSKKYRDGKKRHGSVTRDAPRDDTDASHPPETEQKQNRAEAEQKRAREADLRQAIVKAFETANSPNLPETSIVGLWLEQGYEPAIILAVISDIVARKPSITTLKYFERAIIEAHQSKAPPRIEVGPTLKMDLEKAVAMFAKSGVWSRHAPCPEPGLSGCTASAELLAKYGLMPDGRKLEATS